MAERLVSKRLFWQAPVSGTAVSGPTSSAIDLRTGVLRLESLTYTLSSVLSTPDVAMFYRVSPDGVTWGSFADFLPLSGSLLTSTFSGGNPQGYHTLALPNALAPFIEFAVSGVGSNPQDSLCTMDLLLRMSQ